MVILIFFAFLAGIVTILSPCILPILPVVLSGSLTGGKRRPWGIVTGFILSFTFFTLALTSIVKATGVSPDALRSVSVVVIAGFGLTLLVPPFQRGMERLFSKLSFLAPRQDTDSGFGGGILIGLSLGLLWTPCVGPILASVITLAATSSVTANAVFITFAYSVGTAIPLLLITYGGRALLHRVPWLLCHAGAIQKIFGILMIFVAVGIYFNLDRRFQTYVLEKFPNYGTGLTKLEEKAAVTKELEKIKGTSSEQPLPPQAPELIPGGQWFNSEPLTLAELRGKVVLIDFWTYTCINCIRTLPYLKNWHEKYTDKGLVIIGVHSPEFEFEKNPDNLARAIEDFGLEYPIMQDNDFATWRMYRNRYWPAKYFIDKDGVIRSSHFGEGAYDESEELLRQLLKEAGAVFSEEPISNMPYSVSAETPETYLGYDRINNFGSPEEIQSDIEASYTAPAAVPFNTFAYQGAWSISEEHAAPSKGSSLIFHFSAGNVYLVMRPRQEGKDTKIKILLDGKVVSEKQAGDDVIRGMTTVAEDRLYKLVHLEEPGSHLLKLEFLDDNAELYAFTFG